MSHVHKWYLFYKTVSGDVVALCEDPECPDFLGEAEIIERINAVEHRLHADGADVCHIVTHFFIDGTCAMCGVPEPRPAGKA